MGARLQAYGMARDPILCPECGWTGTQADLDSTEEATTCPACDTNIEFVE